LPVAAVPCRDEGFLVEVVAELTAGDAQRLNLLARVDSRRISSAAARRLSDLR